MVMGYAGTYRGTVLNVDDPLQQNRLLVTVPEIYGDSWEWASASLSSQSAALPAVGDLVWVSFEHGDSDYPVWQLDGDAVADGTGGTYMGKYRGLVVNRDDPEGRNRLQVEVPEIDPSPAWAVADVTVASPDDLPQVGDEVWIEYEYGDAQYPHWVGLM